MLDHLGVLGGVSGRAFRLGVMHGESIGVLARAVLKKPEQAGLEIVGAMRRNPDTNVHRISSPALSVAKATY